MIPVTGAYSAHHDSRALLATVIFKAALIRVVTFVRIDATSRAYCDRVVSFSWFRHSCSRTELLTVRLSMLPPTVYTHKEFPHLPAHKKIPPKLNFSPGETF